MAAKKQPASEPVLECESKVAHVELANQGCVVVFDDGVQHRLTTDQMHHLRRSLTRVLGEC